MRPTLPHRRSPCAYLAAAAACTLLPLRAPAQTATWLSPTTGTWSDPANWSTNPSYPNNSTLAAFFNATGSPYTITLNSHASLNSLTSTSPDAILNLTTGGTLTLASALALTSGTLSLTGGALSAFSLTSTGSINWTAGSLTITKAGLTIDSTTIGSDVTLSPSQSLTTFGNPLNLPTGSTLTLNGATVSPNKFSLTGGALSINSGLFDSGLEEDLTAGTVTQTGGTHSAYIAYYGNTPGSTASYSISAGTASSNHICLGGDDFSAGGTAILSISGSASFSTQGLTIYDTPGTSLNLAGGSLSIDSLTLPQSSPSHINWTAGSFSVTGSTGLDISALGSTPTLSSSQTLKVSRILTIPAGTSLSVAGASISAATLTIAGGASVTQSAGTFSLATSPSYAADFVMGATNSSSTASYTLSGGSLNASREDIGYYNATFNQTGGTNTVSGLLQLATFRDASAQYLLSNGTLSTNTLYTDYGGNGTFTQSGGTLSVANSLEIGLLPASNGTFSLSGGSLLAFNSIILGVDNNFPSPTNDTFLQTGGTAATSSLYISPGYFSTATYSISAGSLSASEIYVGNNSTSQSNSATFSICGSASVSTSGTLTIFHSTNTSVSLGGGSLSLSSLDTSFNPSHFSWTAGTLFFTSTPPSISPAGPFGPSLKLSPNMTLHTTALPSISPGSSLDISGGTLLISYTGPSPVDQLRNALQSSLIFSSSANSDPQHLLALGYSDLSSTLTVQLATLGDANLDGKINADDYALLDRSYAQHLPNPHWTDGDFNYDGTVDQNDYLLIDQALYQAQGFSPGFLSQRESQFGAPYVQQLLTTLPEPALLAACGLALPFLPRRRLRR